MDPHSRAPKKNTSHGNEMLPQDTTHLIQRPCYKRPCQDPEGNWTTRRPDDRKEMQTAVVWSCFPFIRSGQNYLARHSERGNKTRLKPVWIDKSISLSSKIRQMRFLVTSIFLYACESWTLTVELQRKIQAMETRCYSKILRISYKDHVTNEEVHALSLIHI